MLAAHDIVDAHMHGIIVEREARTASSDRIAVGESLSDGSMNVRQRMVVDVSAEDDALALMLTDVGIDGIGLRATH